MTLATATIPGVVVARPQVRHLPAGRDGLSVPVLCLEVRSDGISHAPITVQQRFAPGATRQCVAAARRIQPGQHITVEAPLEALHLTVAGAAHIREIKTEGTPE